MKNVVFKKIYIKNFFSVGEEAIELSFKNGINFIKGNNLDVSDTSNGSGKTTIIEAFNFAIFGKTLKKVDKAQMINNITKNTAEIVLDFDIISNKITESYKISRTIAPSRLTLYKNNENITLSSIGETNQFIINLLSSSEEVFKNCIILKANHTQPFLLQNKNEKRKFIENLFNLDIITKLAKVVKQDISISKHNIDTAKQLKYNDDNTLVDYKSKLEAEKNKVVVVIAEIKSSILKKKEEYDNVIIKITEFEDTIKELKSFDNSKLEALRIKQSQVLKQITKLETEYDIRKKDIKKNAEFTEGNICFHCKQEYSDEFKEKNKAINDKLINENEELLTKINTFNDANEKLTNAIEKLNINYLENNDKLIKASKELSLLEGEKKACLLAISNLKKEIDSNKDSVTDMLNEMIQSITIKIDERTKEINKLEKEYNVLDVARYILSEEGIKSYLINKLLGLLNHRIKFYLGKLNSQYTLSFNEFFEEEIFNKKSNLVGYGNLSGAESKMLDLACIWSFRDILKVQNNISYNIAFYDEILDSSMDSKNSEIVCNILTEIANTDLQSIYLISHKTDFLKAVTGDIIEITKENGISRMIK